MSEATAVNAPAKSKYTLKIARALFSLLFSTLSFLIDYLFLFSVAIFSQQNETKKSENLRIRRGDIAKHKKRSEALEMSRVTTRRGCDSIVLSSSTPIHNLPSPLPRQKAVPLCLQGGSSRRALTRVNYNFHMLSGAIIHMHGLQLTVSTFPQSSAKPISCLELKDDKMKGKNQQKFLNTAKKRYYVSNLQIWRVFFHPHFLLAVLFAVLYDREKR